LVEHMLLTEIDPEIKEALDLIVSQARAAKPKA
jgi:hypothetical protein